MELSREAAMKAFEDKVKENKKNAASMKVIEEKGKKERAHKKKLDQANKKRLVQGVLETRDNAAQEKLKVVEKKKEAHEKQKKEMFELVEMRREEEKVEKRKRDEIIRQIRELERQPRERMKGYDPTETAGTGLLNEMSIVELRERLAQLKEERKLAMKKKKEENVSKKAAYLSSLHSKVDNIQNQRQALKAAKQEEREAKKLQLAQEQEKAKILREKGLVEVYEKISTKKAQKKEEEERIAREAKEIKMKRQYLNANQAIVEEMAWKSLQNGAERDILKRQNDKLMLNMGLEGIKMKDRKILAETAKRELEGKLDFMKSYDENLVAVSKENEALNRVLREEKLAMHKTVREFEEKHKTNMIERDTFKHKMSEKSLASAKKASGMLGKSNKEELPPAQYEEAF